MIMWVHDNTDAAEPLHGELKCEENKLIFTTKEFTFILSIDDVKQILKSSNQLINDNDLISRQAVINGLEEQKFANYHSKNPNAEVISELNLAIGNVMCLSPIDIFLDLISRQAAIDEWRNDFKGYINALDISRDDYNGIMAYIDELPPA